MAKHYEPAEYVWNLLWEGENKIFKVLVTDTECITYLGDQEHKHLKITNPVRKNKVLQIDTQTSIYGKMVPFQLENGIPYIQLDGVWKMSDTDREARILRGKKINTMSAWIEIGAGALMALALGAMALMGINIDRWWILIPMGVMLIVGGFASLARLKAEMEALEAAIQEEKEARDAACAEAKAAKEAENC